MHFQKPPYTQSKLVRCVKGIILNVALDLRKNSKTYGHFVRSYKDTYNLPVVISNCSNNFGPNQFTEKLIPLVVQNIINNKSIPVYGNGENIRDWIYVDDHVEAIDLIFHKGKNRGDL